MDILKFLSMSNRQHYRHAVKPDGTYICQLCGKYSSDATKFRKHIWYHKVREINPITCTICNEIHQSRYSLEKHTSETHGMEYSCDECSKSFSNSYCLKQHKKTHKVNNMEIICDLCEEETKFTNKRAFVRHMDSKHSGNVYRCNICDRIYSNAFYLKKHKVVHDEGYVVPSFLCNICGKTYSTKYHLKGHQKIEHEGQKFICSLCGKMLTSSYSLVVHMRRHNKEKPYNCKICDKAFVKGTALKLHLRTHTKEKPHVCERCGKSYAQRTPLVTHIKTVHENERPFQCSICSKGFVYNSLLNSHMKIHSKSVN